VVIATHQKRTSTTNRLRLAQRAFHQALLTEPLDEVALAAALNDLEPTCHHLSNFDARRHVNHFQTTDAR